MELQTLGSSFIIPRSCGIPNCLKEACSLSLPSAGYIFAQNALCSQALLRLCLICTDPPLCLIGSFLYETISNLDISLFVSLVPPCHLSGWSGGVSIGYRSWDIPLFLKTSWGVSHGKGLGVQFLAWLICLNSLIQASGQQSALGRRGPSCKISQQAEGAGMVGKVQVCNAGKADGIGGGSWEVCPRYQGSSCWLDLQENLPSWGKSQRRQRQSLSTYVTALVN